MFKKKNLFFLGLSMLLAFPFPGLAVGTDVSSSITNPIWTPDNSPYVVSNTIEVAKGATLKIEAGTEVRFNKGAKILVKGELQINGSASNPVILTSNATSSAIGDWGGIEFADSSTDAKFQNGEYQSGSLIKNAIIKFSKGVACTDASPYISDSQFSYNTVGLSITGGENNVGEVVADLNSSNGNGTIAIYIEGNDFSNNEKGLVVDRGNSQDFISTPAGYSYIGDPVTTAYILNNSFTSNNLGISIVRGDSNVISNNSAKYNTSAAIQIAALSRGNYLEKNTIQNNGNGIESLSAESIIVQNTIKNNFGSGLKLGAKPEMFRYNSIFNNQSYNLHNLVYNLDASQNYWGESTDNLIISKFLKTETASSTSGAMIYSLNYQPALGSAIDTDKMTEVIINNYATSTLAASTEVSGIKPLGSSVFVNDIDVKATADGFRWKYQSSLEAGDNEFSIYYQDANGRRSSKTKIIIRRDNELAAPVLDTYPSETSNAILELKGTKVAGSSVIINGQERVAADNASTWSYKYPLNVGDNNLELMAKSANGQYSAVITASVKRIQVTDNDIISQEKNLSAKTDAKLAARLAGRLLLQVENKGLIWYVSPENNKRYYISQSTALSIFRSLALGISENNLNLIPAKGNTNKGNAALRQRLKGKLLLRVENKGQISYVDLDGYRHDISQTNLMDIFRSLSLGITNENIRKIEVAEIK